MRVVRLLQGVMIKGCNRPSGPRSDYASQVVVAVVVEEWWMVWQMMGGWMVIIRVNF